MHLECAQHVSVQEQKPCDKAAARRTPFLSNVEHVQNVCEMHLECPRDSSVLAIKLEQDIL